jgi:hypothetical protein
MDDELPAPFQLLKNDKEMLLSNFSISIGEKRLMPERNFHKHWKAGLNDGSTVIKRAFRYARIWQHHSLFCPCQMA